MTTATMTGRATGPGAAAELPGRWRALGLATLAFTVNFWAWGLLSPLAPRYKSPLHLSPLAVSVLVAAPATSAPPSPTSWRPGPGRTGGGPGPT